jgi:phosphoglycerate dehydrogenase-like enzyme
MIEVYFPRPANSPAIQDLQAQLDGAIRLTGGAEIPNPAEYHILIAGRPTKEQLEASPNLETLVIPWAGLPVETAALMPDYPHIAIHNIHHNAVTTAETALTLMMAATKCLIPIERTFRQHDWRPRYDPNPALVLDGKTALILGYGSVGQHVGKMCGGLGMEILAVRKDPSLPVEIPAEVHPPEALDQLLPRANVLFVTLPLTAETEGLIGEREINLLPPKAVIVNVGRALVIDQAALYYALREGRLHSAGLDVWYNYPPDEAARANTPPADFPFNELDNVVLSPHRGGGSDEIEARRIRYLAELLNLAAAGKPLPNRVDLVKGY